MSWWSKLRDLLKWRSPDDEGAEQRLDSARRAAGEVEGSLDVHVRILQDRLEMGAHTQKKRRDVS